MEEVLEAVFSARTVQEATKGEPSAWGVYLGYHVPGGYKYGDLALQVDEVSNLSQ
jgi:hypothetical protein